MQYVGRYGLKQVRDVVSKSVTLSSPIDTLALDQLLCDVEFCADVFADVSLRRAGMHPGYKTYRRNK